MLRNYGRVPAEIAAKTPDEKAAASAESAFALTHEGRGHTQPLTALALAGDDETLFSTAADQTVKRWFAARSEPRLVLSGHKGAVYGLSFSPDGKLLAAAGADLFPVERWARLHSELWRTAPDAALYEGSGAGWQPLREAVAAYLLAVRGFECSPEQVIVLTSSQAALNLAVRVLGEAGDARTNM